jgi:hypothetical protein
VDKSILDKDGRQKYGGFLKKRGQMFEFWVCSGSIDGRSSVWVSKHSKQAVGEIT